MNNNMYDMNNNNMNNIGNMDNKNSNNKSNMIIPIVLLILLISAGSYIVYDKFFKEDTKTKEVANNKETSNEKENTEENNENKEESNSSSTTKPTPNKDLKLVATEEKNITIENESHVITIFTYLQIGKCITAVGEECNNYGREFYLDNHKITEPVYFVSTGKEESIIPNGVGEISYIPNIYSIKDTNSKNEYIMIIQRISNYSAYMVLVDKNSKEIFKEDFEKNKQFQSIEMCYNYEERNKLGDRSSEYNASYKKNCAYTKEYKADIHDNYFYVLRDVVSSKYTIKEYRYTITDGVLKEQIIKEYTAENDGEFSSEIVVSGSIG